MMAATVLRPVWPMAAKVVARERRLAAIVRPATIRDVYAIASRMRAADAAEARALGRDPRQALRLSFRSSLTPPKVAELDGASIAMWGMGGAILSDTGAPWLVTTPEIERIPITFLRIARQEIAQMLACKPTLENIVAAEYHGAIRLLEALGFQLGPAEPIGVGGAPLRRFTMGRD